MIRGLKTFFKRKYEDIFILPYLNNYHFRSKNTFEENDIFIAGYPKSGNTWLTNLMASVQYGINGKYLPQKLSFELIPPVKGRRFYKRMMPNMIFKTHELPDPRFKKVILLVRDGRDVMVSYHKMNQKMGKSFSLNDMILSNKGVYPSSWSEYYKIWNENPYSAEILTIRYEDLLADPSSTMKEIVQFCNLDRSDELIEECIQGNNFDQMKRKEKEYGHNNKSFKDGFYRKGVSGDYKSQLNGDLLKHFEEKSISTLKKYSYLQ